MPLSKTPKNKDESLFSAPIAQVFDDVDKEDTPQKAATETDRIAELERMLSDLRERQDEARNDALLSTPINNQWQSQVTDHVEVKPESIQLPDPALDPDGYSDAVNKRAQLTYENNRRRDEAQRKRDEDINSKVSDLWSDFGVEYSDYANDKERIDYIATQVVKDATKKGLDVQRYMFGTGRSRFMKDVVRKYDKVFGAPETDDDENTNYDHSRKSSRVKRKNDDDDGRSTSVFGGNEGGGRAPRRNVDVEDGPSMIDDIHAMQRKTGFW